MKKVYIYGGAFDPVTTAHTAIITELFNRLKKEPDSLLYILVSDNDTKHYKVECEDRIAMIVHTVNSLHSLYSDTSDSPAAYNQGEPSEIFHRVKIVDEVSRTAEALQNLRKDDSLSDAVFTIVLGTDEWHSLLADGWVNSNWLIENNNFLVVRRARYESFFHNHEAEKINLLKDRTEEVDWIIPDSSSTKARSQMGFDPLCSSDQVSPIVMEYIRRNHLYGQSTTEAYQKVEDLVLTKYDPFRYPRPSVTVTSVIIYATSILLVKRKAAPFHDYWCLPGGFANPKESVEDAGIREVKEETDLKVDAKQVQQVGVFTPLDPRSDCHPDYWMYDVGIMVDLDRGANIIGNINAKDDAKDAMWCPISMIDKVKLAFHHKKIIDKALKMRNTINKD